MYVNIVCDTKIKLMYSGDMELFEWLNRQCGPGQKFASPRQLSLAISEGHDQSALSNMEARGLTTIRNVQRIAQATGISQLRVLLMAGIVTEDEIQEFGGLAAERGVLSIEEEEWVQMLRQAPPILRESILQGLRAGLRTLEALGELSEEAGENPNRG